MGKKERKKKKKKKKKALTGKRCHVGLMRRIKMRNPCWILLRWKEIGNDGGRKGRGVGVGGEVKMFWVRLMVILLLLSRLGEDRREECWGTCPYVLFSVFVGR